MKSINRGVVVIKPREPFLEWINRESPLSLPVTMEYLHQDCTAILVPDLYSLEDMLDYLEPLKPMLFEAELKAWNRDPATWPQERTAETFDAWFKPEAHSEVWDAVDVPIAKGENGEPITLAGTWRVISSPDFDDDYLCMETTPYVELQDGTEVSGKFHIGSIVGSLFGRPYPGWDSIVFSFEATAEMEPVNGAGTLTLLGERLTLKLLFHLGDEYTFECARS